MLARLDAEGCARYVVTDVNKDGMLQGPNLDLLAAVCAATDRPVVASGGITELADLQADLNKMLGYFEKLQELDTEGVSAAQPVVVYSPATDSIREVVGDRGRLAIMNPDYHFISDEMH